MTNQPNLFDGNDSAIEDERVVLYALGDFVSRGKVLADRELPLERLLGAFRRAFENYSVKPLSDARLATVLKNLGAQVTEVPDFVAKHPFRVVVSARLAQSAEEVFRSERKPE